MIEPAAQNSHAAAWAVHSNSAERKSAHSQAHSNEGSLRASAADRQMASSTIGAAE
jgi:hypothetical protein